MESQKIDEYTIEITKEVPIVEPVINKYERSFIEKQILDIQKSKDEFNTLRDLELVECNQILAEMDKLNIMIKPEVIKEEIVKPLVEEVIK